MHFRYSFYYYFVYILVRCFNFLNNEIHIFFFKMKDRHHSPLNDEETMAQFSSKDLKFSLTPKGVHLGALLLLQYLCTTRTDTIDRNQLLIHCWLIWIINLDTMRSNWVISSTEIFSKGWKKITRVKKNRI